MKRREFLQATAAATGATMLAGRSNAAPTPTIPQGKAEHCIFLWLGGGAGQIDTWDPKEKGDPAAKKPGSYYDAVETAIAGTKICEHLPRCAKILDRFNVVRSVHHEVIDEHAAAVNRVHTGRPTSETIVYPSIGSIVAHERGPAGEGVPAYVLIGYPNVTRGPGFLGAKHSYVYLTDTSHGPAGLSRPPEITADRQQRREKLLAGVRNSQLERAGGDKLVRDYDGAIEASLKLAGPQFQRIFELNREPDSLRNDYGGEFGQRCL